MAAVPCKKSPHHPRKLFPPTRVSVAPLAVFAARMRPEAGEPSAIRAVLAPTHSALGLWKDDPVPTPSVLPVEVMPNQVLTAQGGRAPRRGDWDVGLGVVLGERVPLGEAPALGEGVEEGVRVGVAEEENAPPPIPPPPGGHVMPLIRLFMESLTYTTPPGPTVIQFARMPLLRKGLGARKEKAARLPRPSTNPGVLPPLPARVVTAQGCPPARAGPQAKALTIPTPLPWPSRMYRVGEVKEEGEDRSKASPLGPRKLACVPTPSPQPPYPEPATVVSTPPVLSMRMEKLPISPMARFPRASAARPMGMDREAPSRAGPSTRALVNTGEPANVVTRAVPPGTRR